MCLAVLGLKLFKNMHVVSLAICSCIHVPSRAYSWQVGPPSIRASTLPLFELLVVLFSCCVVTIIEPEECGSIPLSPCVHHLLQGPLVL